MKKQIEGLTAFGYTAQTFQLAQALDRSPAYVAKLRQYLEAIERPNAYSNQDFDRQQSLASFFADIIRENVA